jgi:Cd(II)/Pb(II)-responsive transcriptional regulator
MNSSLQIGQLAARHEVSIETIRFYERQGLLPKAKRSPGNYRLYTDDHVERLNFILNCRFLDMSLGDIKTLLKLRSVRTNKCADVRSFIDNHVVQLEQRMAELRQVAKQLKALRIGCNLDSSIEDCTVLIALDTSDSIRKGARVKPESKRQVNVAYC